MLALSPEDSSVCDLGAAQPLRSKGCSPAWLAVPHCSWGCRGSLEPAQLLSSSAKAAVPLAAMGPGRSQGCRAALGDPEPAMAGAASLCPGSSLCLARGSLCQLGTAAQGGTAQRPGAQHSCGERRAGGAPQVIYHKIPLGTPLLHYCCPPTAPREVAEQRLGRILSCFPCLGRPDTKLCQHLPVL